MNKQRGFSLLEIAIVMIIITLLLGFGIPGYKHWMESAEDLDERQRAGYSEHAYQMKTGKPCPVHPRQLVGVPADLLALCPPIEVAP